MKMVEGVNAWYYEMYCDVTGTNKGYSKAIARKAKEVYHSFNLTQQRREGLIQFYQTLCDSPLQRIYNDYV